MVYNGQAFVFRDVLHVRARAQEKIACNRVHIGVSVHAFEHHDYVSPPVLAAHETAISRGYAIPRECVYTGCIARAARRAFSR